MRSRPRIPALSIFSALALTLAAATTNAAPGPQFSVRFAPSRSAAALDGRVFILLSTNPDAEPRMQINGSVNSQLIFGLDVDAWQPDQPIVVNENAYGYPIKNLRDLKPGEYYVQALLHRYETFHRADGHTVKLPMDRGEGQHWNVAPGNLYSKPQKMTIGADTRVSVVLDQEIPAIPEPQDTKYIKHLKIQSKRLTEFWGRPMFLSANVLVPEGFDSHPGAHYPLAIFEDHFNHDFEGLRTAPPDPNLKPDYSERFHLAGYNRIQQEEAYKFYQQWTGANFPRLLVVQINHANPYYDDSYAVNSANLGPYGDAIENELIPAIEKQFRGIGQGWARFVYGGSTGGWISMAVQMFYPDHYNGAFIACPDPVDFRSFTTINIYKDKNAFYIPGPHQQFPRFGERDYLGRTLATVQSLNQYELALGSHARSGEQFDIWQAVYSPVGKDGYPQPIFDKDTGEIDPAVAAYWKEHYDLSAILQRDWATLGPQVRGKLNIYVGTADTYFLDAAVYQLEDFLKATKNPPYDGEVQYGIGAEHCWNGDPHLPNAYSRLHYNTMYLPKILDRIAKTAPPGADLTSWKY
ncbi:MAG TPA: alpha/beta hydrolase-fold protein [Candidatus Saccharimonadales bacterium]|nr:alpha/beta hydrolase-fold protein [Candidatus Saccharimonadales bacterium]